MEMVKSHKFLRHRAIEPVKEIMIIEGIEVLESIDQDQGDKIELEDKIDDNKQSNLLGEVDLIDRTKGLSSEEENNLRKNQNNKSVNPENIEDLKEIMAEVIQIADLIDRIETGVEIEATENKKG